MGGGQRDRRRLGFRIDRLDPAVEDDVGADTVVGHRHDGGEPHVVLGDRTRITDPLRHIPAAKAHREHPVGDRGVQAYLLGDLVVPVDGLRSPDTPA